VTDYFVSANGDDTTGLSFDTAYLTITQGLDALVAGSAGDRLFIDDGVKQDYTSTGNHTYTAGTFSSPMYVMSVDENSADTSSTNGDLFTYSPMTQTLTTGTLDFGLTVNIGTSTLNFAGEWIFRGVNIINKAGVFFIAGGTYGTSSWEDCLIGSARNVLATLRVNSSSASTTLRNCSIYLPVALGSIGIGSGGFIRMWGCTLHTDYAGTSYLFYGFTSLGGRLECYGCDFQATPASFPILGSLSTNESYRANFHGCHFADNPVFNNHSTIAAEDRVRVNSAAWDLDTAMFESYEYGTMGEIYEDVLTYGNAVHETSISYSMQMTASSAVSSHGRSLSLVLGEMWLSANATVKVKITSSVSVKDSEFWLEVHSPDATYGGLRNVQSTRVDPANEAALPTDGSSPWNVSKGTDQVVTISLSGGQAGSHTIVAHHAYVELGIWVDPEVVIS
jgi:hypothetical protein